MLRHLYVQKEVVVQDNVLIHIYNLSGRLCSTDAVWLKNEFQQFSHTEEILLDLSQVEKVDLTAINALAQGHKQHRLSVVMPSSPEAAELFHLTKFTDILITLPAVPVYQETEVFA